MESMRLGAGSWPLNVLSKQTLSSDDMADIVTKVNGTKKSMKLFNGLQEEVSKMAKETTISMLTVMRLDHNEELAALRRRKAELEKELKLTRERLCVTSQGMVKLHQKMSLLQAENEHLREQLNIKRSFDSSQKREMAGNETDDKKPTVLPCEEARVAVFCNTCEEARAHEPRPYEPRPHEPRPHEPRPYEPRSYEARPHEEIKKPVVPVCDSKGVGTDRQKPQKRPSPSITKAAVAPGHDSCEEYKCCEGCCNPCLACCLDCCKMCLAGRKAFSDKSQSNCKNCIKCFFFLCQCKCCRKPPPPKSMCECSCR